VSDPEVLVHLAKILKKDAAAVEERNLILAQLGLPLAVRQDLRRKYQNEGDSFCYFEEGLSKFFSGNPNATVGHVVECLKELELNSAAGKLLASVICIAVQYGAAWYKIVIAKLEHL
jgi:hypothetical protein